MGAEGDSSVTVSGGDQVNVNIRCANGSKFSVRMSLESTVGDFKAVLAQNCDVPAEQQRLIYKGRILKDDQTLVSYGGSQTNNATRATPASDARPPGVAGLGGLGLPELERMVGMSDPSRLQSILSK